MSSDNLEVALVTPWNTGGGIANYSKRFRDSLEEASVDVRIVAIQYPRTWKPWRFNELLQLIPSSVDVIHVQFEAGVFGKLGISGVCTPTFYFRLAFKDCAVVTTFHEVHRKYPHHSHITGGAVNIRDRLLERIILEISDATVVHTTEAKSILREYQGTQSKVVRMRHPVDVPVAGPRAKDAAREELDVDTETVFVTFGWIESKKRYLDIVRCLPKLPDATYLIAGEPRHRGDENVLDRVFDAAAELGVRDRVRHIGYVPDEDLPTLFGAADAAIVPYEQVTQSGAVNTSLAYHCPVVTTDLPAFEELAAEYDCIRTYADQSELLDILSNFSGGQLTELRNSAKFYADTETWEAFGKQSKELYEEIASQGTY
jgi:glycosyltransferase involved in cell wall biosynthesis